MKKRWILLLLAVLLLTSCHEVKPEESSPISSGAPEVSGKPGNPADPSAPAEAEDVLLEVPTQAVQVNYSAAEKYGAVLTTLEEKEAFFAAHSPKGEKLDDHYDEAFFANHKLVAAYVPVGSGSYWLGVESVRLKNGVLVLNYNEFSTGYGTDGMAAWMLLAEIPGDVSVTAETAVELTGYDIYYYSQAAEEFEGSEAMLLDSRERANFFMGIYCPRGFFPDGGDWDPLDYADFEETCFIAVYVYMWDSSAEVSLKGLTHNGREAEVRFSCPDPSNYSPGGRVYLLEIPKDHPAVSCRLFSAKVDCPPPPSVEVPVRVNFSQGYGAIDLPLYEGDFPHASVVKSPEELRTVLEEFSADVDEMWDMFDEEFFAKKALLWGYAEAASSMSSVVIGSGWFDIYSDGTARFSIGHRISYQYDGPVVGRLEFKVIDRKYGEMIKRVEIDYGVIKEGAQGGYIPYLPAENVVLNPAHQNAEVCTEEAPPADVTILLNLRDKWNYFEKYAKSTDYGKYGTRLPIAIEDRYDEEFFEKNALIAVYREENSGSNSLQLKEVVIRPDGTVEVFLTRKVPGEGLEGTCDIKEWMFFIEIPVEYPITSANPVKLTVETVEVPYSPSSMQFTVLYPVHQTAEVSLQNPPEEPAVLATLEEKEAYFAKYGLAMEDGYDRAFFEENTLIAVYQRELSTPINTALKYVAVRSDDVVEVVFERREPGPYDAIAQRLYFIEIPKAYEITSDTSLLVFFQAPPADN